MSTRMSTRMSTTSAPAPTQTHVFSFPHSRSVIFEEAVHTPYVFITTPSPDPVYVKIRLSDWSYSNATYISSTNHANFTLPMSAILGNSTGIYDRSVIVTSEADIMVYGMNSERTSADAFSVLEVDDLDLEYYVASYTPVLSDDPDRTTAYSEVSVSATGQETQVTLTNLEGDVLAEVTLQDYETYQLLSEDDLTGVKITATNPVSVMAGSNCAWIPFQQYEEIRYSGNCGYVMENLPGANGFGNEFVLAPFEGRRLGYVYRVIASMDATSVTVSSSTYNDSFTLNSQEFYEGNISSSEVLVIESDKPVLVAQYSKDRHTEVIYETDAGNPSMVIVTPTTEYKRAALIPVTTLSATRSQSNYINVIVNCDQKDDVTIESLTMEYTSVDGRFCVLSGNVSAPELYDLVIPPPGAFTVQVYGFARYAAYSYQVPGYDPDTAAVTGNCLILSGIPFSVTAPWVEGKVG